MYIHTRSSLVALPSLCLLLAPPLCICLSFSLSLVLPSLPPSASSRGFRSFRESMRHTIDRGTPRKIPPRPAPRVSPSPPGVLTDIFSLAARCAARQRPAPRVPRRPFARSIFTRFSDAGNYITPESDSLDARARDAAILEQYGVGHAARSSCLARIHLAVMNLRIFRLASSVSAFFFSLPSPIPLFFNNV